MVQLEFLIYPDNNPKVATLFCSASLPLSDLSISQITLHSNYLILWLPTLLDLEVSKGLCASLPHAQDQWPLPVGISPVFPD